MYATHIGRIILERYREREQRPDLTAREFFDEVFFPLFFNYERYLMVANNSKFDQAYKQKKKKPLVEEVRLQALSDHHEAVSSLEVHEGHLYLGGYTKNIEAPTSSQVSNVHLPLDDETTYLSWFGTAASVGVKGGVSLLLTDEAVLDRIVEGWFWYRKYMTASNNLKPHQIDTWNGQWLNLITLEGFNASDPLARIPESALSINNKGEVQLNTAEWVSTIYAITQLVGEQTGAIFLYVYSLGQTNTSLGFIPLHLPEVNRLLDVYGSLYGGEPRKIRNRFKALYETEFGFYTVCKLGAVGLRALEPKKLRGYVEGKNGVVKQPKIRNESDEVSFKFYKTWIIAMLDNDALQGKARRLARTVHSIQPDDRGKKVIAGKKNKLLEAKTQRQLIDAATDLLNDNSIVSQPRFDIRAFSDVVSEVLNLPGSRVPLFLSLIRFETALLNAEKQTV